MSDEAKESDGRGPSQRGVEIAVALLAMAFGVLILAGSIQAGMNWGIDGPRPGFFPFYISVFIIGASVINLVSVMSGSGAEGGRFATWEELRRVLSVVAPTAAYVALIPMIGIYVSSFLLIGVFMLWLGGYSLVRTLPIAVLIPVCVFVVFEFWFQIALPKGPLEYVLGL